MESMNKFKILTVVVICMFLFAVGAIYSNTKDATTNKQNIKNESLENDYNNVSHEISQDGQSIQDLANRIRLLDSRVDSLAERVEYGSSDSLNCRILGVMTDSGVERLSDSAAIQAAKDDDKEIVITCSVK